MAPFPPELRAGPTVLAANVNDVQVWQYPRLPLHVQPPVPRGAGRECENRLEPVVVSQVLMDGCVS
ncbi:hypothetical protein GCM10023108_54860 [Saccharopolyspora hordei]